MQRLFWIVILCSITSCSLFDTKEEKMQKLVNEKLLQIDWSDVDAYPLFSDCDETVTKTLQRICFEKKILSHLSADLKAFSLKSEKEVDSVIYLDFRIKNDGNVHIVAIENKEILGRQKKEFVALLTKSLKSLPTIYPALKRGVPVNTKFRMPILLNSK